MHFVCTNVGKILVGMQEREHGNSSRFSLQTHHFFSSFSSFHQSLLTRIDHHTFPFVVAPLITMDMRARLDEKVGKLRSQVMSFANDGIQVSYLDSSMLHLLCVI